MVANKLPQLSRQKKMPTYRNQLAEVLSRIDGVILEARSHIENPRDDTESRAAAAKVLLDMERVRREVEGELNSERNNEII